MFKILNILLYFPALIGTTITIFSFINKKKFKVRIHFDIINFTL